MVADQVAAVDDLVVLVLVDVVVLIGRPCLCSATRCRVLDHEVNPDLTALVLDHEV